MSKRLTGIPATVTDASTTSRVVPSTSVTMARSVRDHALSNEDFPAFGLPTMATLTPDSIRRPRRAVERISSTTRSSSVTRAATSSSSRGSISSSKSSRASSSARRSTQLARAASDRACQATAERGEGAVRGGIRAGGDERLNSLGLREVEAAVEEGAEGELARSRQSHGRAGGVGVGARRSVTEEEGEDALDAHGTAVAVDLDDVFGRVAARGEHRKEEDLVDDLVVVADGAVDGDVGSKGVAARGGVALVARRGAEHRARGGDGVGPERRMMATPPAWGTTGVAMAAMVAPSSWLSGASATSASASSALRTRGARGGRERDAERAEDETRAGTRRASSRAGRVPRETPSSPVVVRRAAPPPMPSLSR